MIGYSCKTKLLTIYKSFEASYSPPLMKVTLKKAGIFHFCSIRNVRWMNDPEVNSFLTARPPTTLWAALKYYLKNRNVHWMYAIEVNNQHVGNCGLYGPTTDSAQLRIMIGDKNYWGKGIGQEAVLQLINVGLEKGLQTIELFVHPKNSAAHKIYKKCGFEVLGEEFLDGVPQLKMIKRLRVNAA